MRTMADTDKNTSWSFTLASLAADIQNLLRQKPDIKPHVEILTKAVREHNNANPDNIIDVNTEIRRTNHESRFNPDAKGTDGKSFGISQLTQETADAMNVDPFDVEQSLKAQVAITAKNQSLYNNDPILTTVAYNAGPRAINFVAEKLEIPTNELTGDRWVDFMKDRRQTYREEHKNNGNDGIVPHAWHEVTLDYVHALHGQKIEPQQTTTHIQKLLTKDTELSKADIKELQNHLNSAGFIANGRPDGVMGPNTRSDIAAYLKANPTLISSMSAQITTQLLNSDFSQNALKAQLIELIKDDTDTQKALRDEVTNILNDRELHELSTSEIKAVQANWQLLGDYPANFKIDGLVGNGTKAAFDAHEAATSTAAQFNQASHANTPNDEQQLTAAIQNNHTHTPQAMS